jgi:peptidoglycan/xylan/chitin deacetylase (PgdA/CDA1 family)
MSSRLALSFDNGPWPGATERVLDELGRRGLRASFFVVGERLRAPEGRRLAERAEAAGHRIGNHTLTHGTPLGERDDPEAERREIEDAQALIGDLAGAERLFRPNGKGRLGPHLLSPAAAEVLREGGYTVVTWSAVPRDWEAGWVERALDMARAAPHGLMVLHDHHLAKAPETLPRFLDALEREGVEVVEDLPEACVPMRRGAARPGLDAIVRKEAEGGRPC